MQRIKVTPSLLNQFRVYRDGQFGEKPDSYFVDYINGGRNFSGDVTFGSAFHKMTEEGIDQFKSKLYYQKSIDDEMQSFDMYTVPVRTKEGVTDVNMLPDCAKFAQIYNQSSNMTHEVRISKTFHVDGFEVVMNGIADSLSGLQIRERKTTGAQVTREKYKNSIQWKCYLFMLEDAQCAHYDIFKLNKPRLPKALKGIVKPYIPKYIHFCFHRYKGLEKDIIDCCSQLIDFLKQYNLIHKISYHEKTKPW